MISTLLVLALITPSSPQELTLRDAVDAIARGENIEAATARLIRGRKPALWLLHDRAKKEDGEARRRLLATLGRFGTSEAEWALTTELKKGGVDGQIGAIQGLGHVKSSRARATLLRHAPRVQPELREAMAEALVETGADEKQLRALAAHESESAREVAVRCLIRMTATPFVVELAGAALRDESPRVLAQSLVLAGQVRDPSQLGALSRIAREAEEDLAALAVEAIAKFEAGSTASELALVASHHGTPEKAWQRAAELLRERDRGQLVRAVARASGSRRDALARFATLDAEPEEIDAVIDLVDDPSNDVARAAMTILIQSGEAGRRAAEARLRTLLLPEVETALRNFLAMPRAEAPVELSAR